MAKANSLLRFVDNYTVIDIETTGHSLYYDYIIELSAAKYRNNELYDTFTTLINCGKNINQFIVELTGISNKMISIAPRFSEVVDDFFDFIGDDYLVGHNVSFDINFINLEASKENNRSLENYFVDTLRLSRRLLKNIENHKLTTVAKHFGIDRTIHRGLVDCEVTHRVYQAFKQMVTKEDIDSNGDLVQVKRAHSYRSYSKDFSSIIPTVDIKELQDYLDEFFFEKNVVITGKLTHFTKSELGQIIVNQGGFFASNITTDTNVLILGNTDYQESIYKSKSTKHLKAEKMIFEGYDIKIIDEYTAYNLLGINTFQSVK